MLEDFLDCVWIIFTSCNFLEGSNFYYLDVLPHDKKMFWNCAADHIEGKQSRYELIAEWKSLIENI